MAQRMLRSIHMVESRMPAIEMARSSCAESADCAWLQAMVDQLPDGVALLDAYGQLKSQNQALQRLIGTERGGPIDLRSLDGRRLAWDELPGPRALARREAVPDTELVVWQATGNRVPVLVSAVPVRGQGAEVIGAAMVVRDISAHKAIEQLHDEWAALVAHDLQQPVSSIALGSELALAGPLAPEPKAMIEVIHKSALRISRMIHDLTEITAIEARRLVLDVSPCDLATLVREVVARSLGIAHRVRVHVPRDPVIATCDPDRFEQVLSNLLVNASKYSAKDSTIQVAVERGEGIATISVRNAGPGIRREDMTTLFDRYIRTRGARRSGIGGSGLGLYIAKGLVEAHGGQISVTSVPDCITTFSFTMPLARDPVRASPELAAPIAKALGADIANRETMWTKTAV